MDSDDEPFEMFVLPRFPPNFLVVPRTKVFKQVPAADFDKLVPDTPAKAEHLFSFSDALITNVARLNVNNMSLDRQAFILFPSAPTLFGMSPAPESLRFGIFQSSKLVDKLSEGSNFGSVTFKLPFDKPLNWANKNASPGIIVITGTESTEDDPRGVGEFALTPEITHWTLLSSGKTDGHPAKNSCVMSMAKGEEPRFLNSTEMAEGNYTEFKDLKPGTIVIKTDDLVGRDNDGE
ncbi:hypothetical protein K4K54_007332 [Colletotrichum sp. SAR 10_86]|nr:hypothetical protein K4K54_007332 [Colletotrichum sp. SAR 10_86]